MLQGAEVRIAYGPPIRNHRRQNSMPTLHGRRKVLGGLFAASIAASSLHYVDNIAHLEIYPDLPTTTTGDIAAF